MILKVKDFMEIRYKCQKYKRIGVTISILLCMVVGYPLPFEPSVPVVAGVIVYLLVAISMEWINSNVINECIRHENALYLISEYSSALEFKPIDSGEENRDSVFLKRYKQLRNINKIFYIINVTLAISLVYHLGVILINL